MRESLNEETFPHIRHFFCARLRRTLYDISVRERERDIMATTTRLTLPRPSTSSSAASSASASSSSRNKVMTTTLMHGRRPKRKIPRTVKRSSASASTSRREEDEDEDNAGRAAEDAFFVNYFAYGSNVGSKTFSTRRNIQPKRVQNGKILDYQLSFNVPGVPFLEPAFASVTRQKGKITHGVCYTITKDEFQYLLQTEGSYDVVDVDVVVYGDKDIEGVLMKAKTLTHRDVAARRDLQPSKRYRDLIVEGAKERGLEKSWIEFLEKMPYFDPNEKPLNAFEMSVLAAALPVVLARAAPKIFDVVFSNSGEGGNDEKTSNERKLIESFLATQEALYDVHDSVEGVVGRSGVLGDNRI